MELKGKHIAIALRGVVDERTKKLARALATCGADVWIHAFTFNGITQDDHSYCVKYHESVEPKGSELLSRILRVAHNLTIKKIQARLRTLNQGEFGYKYISEVLISENPDLIIAINADTLAACAQAAQKLNIKYVYESYEFWPDHAKEQACVLNKRQRNFLLESERTYAQSAALVVSVSGYLADEYTSELHLKRRPEVVLNAPDTVASMTSPVHKPLKALFLGNIQRERNVQTMLSSIAQVQEASLTFQGRGSMVEELQAETKRLGASGKVFFNEPVPYNQVASSASCYDVGIICHEAYNRQMEGALPNKFFEYLAGGLAVLAPCTKAFENVENFSTFGMYIETNNPKSISKALEYLRDNPDVLFQMKKHALEESKKYCGDAIGQRIKKVYEGLCDK